MKPGHIITKLMLIRLITDPIESSAFSTRKARNLRELVWRVGELEVAHSQRANLFHLADGARSFRRRVVAETLKQLAHYVPFGVHPRAYYKREAKALLVLGV